MPSARSRRSQRLVLLYRLQSLGDSVVALPSFHLVARAFPDARRVLVSNLPRDREVHGSGILDGSGLVHDFVDYPTGTRSWADLGALRARIVGLDPDLLVYMAAFRGRLAVLRDVAFFRACGVRRMVGVPWTSDAGLRRHLGGGRFENEAARLARCLGTLGDAGPDGREAWDLRLRADEQEAAAALLRPLGGRPFLAAAVGARIPEKDWGEDAWRGWASQVSRRAGGMPLVLVGGPEDRERSDRVAAAWAGGATLNLCGALAPRVSSAVLGRAEAFVGTDSGPMHLAAAAGARCAVIFTGYNRPGEWYPCGDGHVILHRSRAADVAVADLAGATLSLVGGHARDS